MGDDVGETTGEVLGVALGVAFGVALGVVFGVADAEAVGEGSSDGLGWGDTNITRTPSPSGNGETTFSFRTKIKIIKTITTRIATIANTVVIELFKLFFSISISYLVTIIYSSYAGLQPNGLSKQHRWIYTHTNLV